MSKSKKRPMHVPKNLSRPNSSHDIISPEDTPTRKSKPKRELPNGYHCNLVKPLHRPLQIHCAACLGILCDPCQATCCGQGYCQPCLDNLITQEKNCLHCHASSYESFDNEALRKELKRLEVHCTNQKEGCEWTGTLKKLPQHLNPNEADAKGGCKWANGKCPFCFKSIRRKNLDVHKAESCIKRPYECQYCDFRSSFEDVMTNHRPICSYSPVPCPNNCGEHVVYMDMESHMANDCRHKVLVCEFKEFGCTAELRREEMSDHLISRSSMHLSMMAKALKEVMGERNAFEDEAKQEIQRLTQENKKLHMTLEEMEYTHFTPSKASSKAPIVILNRTTQDETTTTTMAADGDDSTNIDLITAAEFTLNSYSVFKRENKSWYSHPFYTYQGGYRMCLEVMGNGYGEVKGQYVSIYLYLMRGEFDDQLEWPFRGDIVVELLSQGAGPPHNSKTLRYSSSTPRQCAERVVDSERGVNSKGIADFIHLSELPLKFLKNDSLKFRILRYKLAFQRLMHSDS